jgi:hypothetical protein
VVLVGLPLEFRKRRRAGELRIYAWRLIELAVEIDAGRKTGYGTAAGERQRAAELPVRRLSS